MDVGENTTLGDGNSCQQLVQLLVVADGELKVAGVDPLLLVVTGSVSGQLKDLSSQVLHDRGHVDGGSRSNSLGVVPLAKETVNATDWELEPSSARSALGLGAALATFTTSRHNELFSLTSCSELTIEEYQVLFFCRFLYTNFGSLDSTSAKLLDTNQSDYQISGSPVTPVTPIAQGAI